MDKSMGSDQIARQKPTKTAKSHSVDIMESFTTSISGKLFSTSTIRVK
jgi:hypothetical protein